MPAYGKNLSSAETQALVAFLSTLDGGDLPAMIPGAMEQQPGRDESPTVEPTKPLDETDASVASR